MRNPDSYIYDLIKSLSEDERERFFFLARARVNSPSFLELFLIIDKLERYDEEGLKKEAQNLGHSWLGYFPKVKRELLTKIIEVLKGDITSTEKVNSEKLIEGLVLNERGFTELALKSFRKARKKFEEDENFVEGLRTLRVESKILQDDLKDEDFEQVSIEFNKKAIFLKEAFSRVIDLEYWEAALAPVFKKKYHSSGEFDPEKLQNPQLLLLLNQNPISKREEMFILFIRARINYFLRKFYESKQDIEKLYALFENHVFLQTDYKEYYIRTAFIISGYFIVNGETEAFKRAISTLRDVGQSAKGLDSILATKFLFWRISSTLVDFPKMEATFLEEEIRKLENYILGKSGGVIDMYYYHIAFNWAKRHFLRNEKKKTRDFLKLIINNPRKGVQTDIQSIARIVDLCCLIDLGNLELVETHFRSYRNYIKSRENLFFLEKRVLLLIKNLLKEQTKQSKREQFELALNDLEKMSDKLSQTTLFIFDFKDWVSEKLN
ncbi:MAG: hypothetical protein H6581_27950 [Bacteroidia bacterium]|nr:hypothetical protein [Bacteroidia bacterium]